MSHLSPVAGTCQRAQHIHMLELLQQLVHGELHGRADEAIDAQPVLVPSDLGHRPVVAHIVQGGGRDKAVLHQHVRRRLHIEGVPAAALVPLWMQALLRLLGSPDSAGMQQSAAGSGAQAGADSQGCNAVHPLMGRTQKLHSNSTQLVLTTQACQVQGAAAAYLPVSLMRSGCRGTHESGVAASRGSMSVTGSCFSHSCVCGTRLGSSGALSDLMPAQQGLPQTGRLELASHKLIYGAQGRQPWRLWQLS